MKFTLIRQKVALVAVDGSDPAAAENQIGGGGGAGGGGGSSFSGAGRSARAKTRAMSMASGKSGGAGALSSITDATAKPSLEMPPHAIAGLTGELAKKFERRTQVPLVQPVSHVWTTKGEVLLGCDGGQLLRVDPDTGGVTVMFVPHYIVDEMRLRTLSSASPTSRRPSRQSATGSRKTPQSERTGRASSRAGAGGGGAGGGGGGGAGTDKSGRLSTPGGTNVIRQGSLQHMVLHSEGLFVGGVDGVARVLDISAPSGIAILDAIPIGDPIVSMSFSPRFEALVIGSPKGTVFQYVPSTQNLTTVLCTAEGAFVGIGALAPGDGHVVTARKDGQIQVRVDMPTKRKWIKDWRKKKDK